MAALAAGATVNGIQTALDHFKGSAHRLESVATINNVQYFNDSKATNADAASPALASYKRVYWIAGGLSKEGGIASLKPLFPHIVKAYLIGDSAPQFAATLGNDVAYEISGTMENAVVHAAADAMADGGDDVIVLLSPACASYGCE